MVLFFELVYLFVVSNLLLLCVVLAKLLDMAEIRSTDSDPSSKPTKQPVEQDFSQTKHPALYTNHGPGPKPRLETEDKVGPLDCGNGQGSYPGFDDDRASPEFADEVAREVEIDGSVEKKPDESGEIGSALQGKEEVDGTEQGPMVDDDWEGIERSELERLFDRAVRFACSERNAGPISELDDESSMKLYGLRKVALEGPCNVPQPLPFKVSARAKWNAWQQLGSMTPETAMEEYINLIGRIFPGWMQNNNDDGKEDEEEHGCTDAEAFWKRAAPSSQRTMAQRLPKIDHNNR